MIREFPGDLVVRTMLSLPCPGFSPWLGNWDPESHSSVKFNCSVVSDSLWLHGLQHTRIPCPLLSPRVHSNSCSSSRWCHPTISSSVIPFSYLQSLPASGSFQMSQFFALGGPKYWSFSFQWIFRTIFIRIDWFDLFAVQGTLKSLLQHHSSKASILRCSAFFTV